MTSKVLAEVMTAEGGCHEDSGELVVPESTRATVFANLGAGPLLIEALRSASLRDDVVILRTAKGDSFVLAYEDVRAVKFNARTGRAGYAAG